MVPNGDRPSVPGDQLHMDGIACGVRASWRNVAGHHHATEAASMIAAIQEPEASVSDYAAAVCAAICFIQAIFDDCDRVLIRPIETWTDGAKKKSEVHYKGITYLTCRHGFEGQTLLPRELERIGAAAA